MSKNEGFFTSDAFRTRIGVVPNNKTSKASISPDTGCDVVYVTSLTATTPAGNSWTVWHRALDWAIRVLQPAPTLLHVELFIPPTSDEESCHYSTYLGSTGADYTVKWRHEDNLTYYLDGPQAGAWEAYPVFGPPGFARNVRDAANLARGSPYSVLRYFFSGPPGRALAGLLPHRLRSPGHCATLCARVLRIARPAVQTRHSDAWYGPSTLAAELRSQENAKLQKELLLAHAQPKAPVSDVLATLVNGSLESVMALGRGQQCDERCGAATADLARRIVEHGANGADTTSLQKQLAVALFRWSQVARCSRGKRCMQHF